MPIGLLPKEGGNLNIHVGNLAREVTEAELRQAFEPFGRVAAVRIITDRYSGVSRGFGFVEMQDKAEAQAAIEGLNMKELAGRTLDISEAHAPREGRRYSRPSGGGGGGRARPWR
jgi:RNA recognition motif-containing protein